MAYRIPSFPLTCAVWHNWADNTLNYASPDQQPHCNLSPGKRVMNWVPKPPTPGDMSFPMEILLPAGVDVRPLNDGGPADLIECPVGSARFYLVLYVDDIGKGFPNEHRFAIVSMQTNGTTWLDAGYIPFITPLP